MDNDWGELNEFRFKILSEFFKVGFQYEAISCCSFVTGETRTDVGSAPPKLSVEFELFECGPKIVTRELGVGGKGWLFEP